MTASTADYYGILGLTSDATLADVKKAYRKLARQHHPDRNNADPGAIDRFRRITEAYEYLSAHLKGNDHGRPGPTAPPRADVGMPGGFSEAASRVLTMLEQTRQAIRARQAGHRVLFVRIARLAEAYYTGQLQTMYRGSFAYITGVLPGGEQIPLFRLRYGGSAHSFAFAIYSPVRDRYEDAILLAGFPSAARKKHSTPPASFTSQRPGSRWRRTSPVTKRCDSSTNASSACFKGENHSPS